jgi:hypothetical protein
MLYHWYELDPDLNASPLGARSARPGLNRQTVPSPLTEYDKTAATSHARGQSASVQHLEFRLLADNDNRPDAIAARLQRAGLGILGDPAHRAAPPERLTASQIFARCFALIIVARDTLTRARQSLRRAASSKTCTSGHTMDANAIDVACGTSIDAHRQRSAGTAQL